MIKKIVLIISFFSLFWLTPTTVTAQSDPPSGNPPQEQSSPGFFQTIWEAITRFFNYLIFGIQYVSEDYQASTKDTRHLTNDYTRDDKDIASRAIPESVKRYRKGVWFYEVLTKPHKYKNETIKSDQDICPDMKISDIAYVMYQQNQKILYQQGNPDQPLEYDPNLMNQFRFEIKHPLSCYLNAYNNIQDVPQGLFMNEADAAPITSLQLNDTIRNVMPRNFQGENAPPSNDNPQQAKKVAEDSDKQEQNMLLGLLSEPVHDQIACNNNADFNRENLRQSFACHLTPNGWNNSKCGALGNLINTDQIQCDEEYTVKNGPGLSQRGTHGLALSGYNYKEIINIYHGGGIDTERQGDDDKGPIKVVIIEDYGGDSDITCPNLVGDQNYDKVDLYQGSGGVNEDGKTPCDKYVKIPVTDPDNPSSPPYRLEGICYPVVTVPDLYTYLLGVAEVPRNWHIEAQKALTLTHRHTAIQNGDKGFLWNNNKDQAFRCDQVSLNQPKIINGKEVITNQGAAVELTRGEYVVDQNSRQRLHTTARSAFCGPGSYNPKFDGLKYEKISYAFDANGGAINGICFEGIGYTLPSITNISTNTNSQGLISFSNNSSPGRINQVYDLAQIDGGKYLKTYQGNCQLDERIFSSLNQMISAFNTDNPDNQLSFFSCYRSLNQQTDLWQENLAQNNGDQYQTISQINYPGTSPHHTGRAIDFADKNGKLTSNSPAYQWLVANASKFGFYHHQLEPEHWDYNP